VDGYIAGGYGSGPGIIDMIQRFPYADPFVASTDVGTITGGRYDMGAATDVGTQTGYIIGGYTTDPAPSLSALGVSTISSFSLTSPTTTTDVGDLSTDRRAGAGLQSGSDGYIAGGYSSSGMVEVSLIDSFPFASSFTLATNVGNISDGRYAAAGASSDSDGYVAGGYSDVGGGVHRNR
jgi:hypothetical protein